MKKSVRWVDYAQKLSRNITYLEAERKEFVLICTGGAGHLVFLAAQLERFRAALGGPDVPLVVLASDDSGAAAFLFDDRAEVFTVDVARLGEDSKYRANKLGEMFQSNFKGVVSLDYHRHPHLEEALVEATQRPAMAMKPALLEGQDEKLRENAALFQRQFDSGPAGIPLPLRWVDFCIDLSGENPDLPAAMPYRFSDDMLPEPITFDRPTVLLQPFCPDAARQPSAEFYNTVLDSVPDDHQVLLLGSDALLDRTPDIRGLLERPGVALENTDLAGALPMMRSARLVIAAESAPMHVAALAGAPTLGIASDAGNGDILPYPAEGMPTHTRILIGADATPENAAQAARDFLDS